MNFIFDKKTMNIVSLIFVATYFIISLFIFNDTIVVNLISGLIISFTYTGSFFLLLYFIVSIFNKNKLVDKILKIIIFAQVGILFIFSMIRVFSGNISTFKEFLNNPGNLESLIYSLILLIIGINLFFIIFKKEKQEVPMNMVTVLIIVLVLSLFGFLKTSVNILELGYSSYIYLYIFLTTIPVYYSLFLKEEKEIKVKEEKKKNIKLEY